MNLRTPFYRSTAVRLESGYTVSLLLCYWTLMALLCLSAASAATRSIYNADFSPPLFDPAFSLDSQSEWLVSGTGGTGLFVDGIFQGTSAFVGLFPPTNTNTETTAWYPLNMDPLATGEPMVEFAVDFVIWDSTTNTPFADEFRWSVINRTGEPLCELIFDVFSFRVSYLLSGSSAAVDTLQTFQTNAPLTLRMKLDFQTDRWSASLSNHLSRSVVTLATHLPLAAAGQALDLGDIDATWIVSDQLNPGDNFMEFDNYSVQTQGPGAFSVALDPILPGTAPKLRITGEAEWTFVLESSASLNTGPAAVWIPIATNQVVTGVFEAQDLSANGSAFRFYRARWLP